jgi:hypothetical protein
VLHRENDIQYVEKAETTHPTTGNTSEGLNVMHSFLNVTSITVQRVSIFMYKYTGQRNLNFLTHALQQLNVAEF